MQIDYLVLLPAGLLMVLIVNLIVLTKKGSERIHPYLVFIDMTTLGILLFITVPVFFPHLPSFTWIDFIGIICLAFVPAYYCRKFILSQTEDMSGDVELE